MASAQNKKVAIVADWIYGGGAEKVLEQLHIIYPDAPIYTSYCSDDWRLKLDNKVVTGYLQNWPFNKLRKFLPLLRQWWFASINLQDFDLVISATGNGEAKFIKKRPDATHICYCHTPPHFYWRKYKDYMKNPGFGAFDFLARTGLFLLVKPLRNRDYKAAQKVDYFVGNSNHIANDIQTFYNRESKVIHPPVNVEKFSKAKTSKTKGNRYIYWGRHVPDKHIDLAINACNELGLDLTIIGKGPETPNLEKLAGPTVKFTGFVDEDQLIEEISGASAFIFPSIEDFGIAPVEALAAGLPIIAYRSGGALDYVEEGKTGAFFAEQTSDSLRRVLAKFDPSIYDKKTLRQKADEFSQERFIKYFTSFVSSLPSAKK